MVNFTVVLLVIFTLIPRDVHSAISDKRLCSNEDCTEPISLAKTTQRYYGNEEGLLSVPPNVDVTVYSRSAGTNLVLWGIEYNGQRGYINKKFLRETKIFKNPTRLVDTEQANIEKVPSLDILPNKQKYEVVDGTTITLNPNDIRPSATEENLQPTESVLDTQDTSIKESAEIKELNQEKPGEDHAGIQNTESIVGSMVAKVANLLNGVNNKDAVNEEALAEVKDGDSVDDELEQETEEDSIIIDEENVEDEIIVKIPKAYKESKNEEPNISNDPTNEDKKFVKESEEVIIDGESAGSIVKDVENEEHSKLGEEESKTESVRQTSSEILRDEDIVVTTENVLDHPYSNIESVESVTEDTGKIYGDELNSDQKQNANGVKESTQNLQGEVEENKNEMGSKLEDDASNLEPEEIMEKPAVYNDNDNKMDIEVKSAIESISSDLEKENSSNSEVFDSSSNMNLTEEEIPISESLVPDLQLSDAESEKFLGDSTLENLNLNDSSEDMSGTSQNTVPENVEMLTSDLNTSESIGSHLPGESDESDDVSQEANKNIVEKETENILEDKSESIAENVSEDNGVSKSWFGFYTWTGGSNTENIEEVKQVDDEDVKQELEIKQEDKSEELESVDENTGASSSSENMMDSEKLDLDHIEKQEHNIYTSVPHSEDQAHHVHKGHDMSSDDLVDQGSCLAGGDDCSDILSTIQKQLEMDFSSINFTDVLNLVTVLGITGLTVVIFLLGYIAIDKSRREAPLIGKINKLEKALLVSTKENQILTEKVTDCENSALTEDDIISSDIYTNLDKNYQDVLHLKNVLEDQIQTLEKELENSTEVGLELNRMLTEILSSQSGSEILVANVENLQRQLVEQQGTITSVNATLSLKDTENHELQLELEIKNKKVIDLQAELDKMALNLLKVEEEKDQIQMKLETEIQTTKEHLDKIKSSHSGNKNKLSEEISTLKKRCSELQKSLDLKSSEYNILKENFNQVKIVKNNKDILKELVQSTTFKAELIELQKENKSLNDLLAQERQIKVALEQRTEEALKEVDELKLRYDEADKEKLEAQTKLEVLGNYFKEKEAELQRDLAKQESLWIEKQGEATSSTERIRYIQQELQNCKTQNELLKQEIVSQEVELKSQISVLEKKAHESWLSARQAERRLDDSKQEAAQLRNRLTLKERSFADDKGQHRMQSPLEQNGDITSPLHMTVESPASPPLIYSTRDHLTTSPPLPGLPPFLPPPPGVPPFIPPPMPGVPGFMPPPPSMFSVDHRPPPLGRMSSPPLNSRYSPDSRYSPYEDRNSPSPPPFEDDYRSASPPRHNRSYSPYRDERRDYGKRVGAGRTNGRSKGVSSGSENSNSETIDRTNRHHTKI